MNDENALVCDEHHLYISQLFIHSDRLLAGNRCYDVIKDRVYIEKRLHKS